MDRIAERTERWLSFFKPDAPPGILYIVREKLEEPGMAPYVQPNQADRTKWMDHIKWTYGYYLRRMGWWDDDLVPHLNMITGTEIFAEAFGCPVYRPANDMPFAQPCVSTPADAARLAVPELSSSTLARVFSMADELAAEFGKDAPLRMADLQSPMDVASLIWDKNTLYDAMLEAPAAVKELSAKVKRLMTAFLDEWFRRYGTAGVAHYPDYYKDNMVSFSVDEVGAVSPAMFDEFFRDELNELSERYGGLGVHCCANARHQWGNFRALKGLRFINMGLWPTIGEVTEFFPGVVHWHNWRPDGPVSTWADKIPGGSRMVIEVYPADRADAFRLAGELGTLRSRMSLITDR